MPERTGDDVCQDVHFLVPVLGETGTGNDHILVHYAQGSVSHARGVPKATKRERMVAVEPTRFRIATI